MLVERTHNVHLQILDALRCWGARKTRGTFACEMVDGDLVPVIVVEEVIHRLSRRDLTGAKQLFTLNCAEHIPMTKEDDDKVRKQLSEIDAAVHIDVTPWEADFLQSVLYEQTGLLTPKQRASAKQIYNKYEDRL